MTFSIGVTDDLTSKVEASSIADIIAKALSGNGGGKQILLKPEVLMLKKYLLL